MTSKDDKNTPQKSLAKSHLGYTDNYPIRDMWREIAKELNGAFKIKHTSGHDLEIHHIIIPYNNWNINISISDSRPLKFIIDFSIVQDFEIIISWEDFIDRFLNKFRKAEIKVGWKEFDNRYLIKSNRPDLVKRSITKEIQKTMIAHNVYSISITPDSEKRTAELISVIQIGAGDKQMIMDLVDMFKSLIDNLKKSNAIK